MSSLLSFIGALVEHFLCLPLIAFALWSLGWHVTNRIRVDALDDAYDKLELAKMRPDHNLGRAASVAIGVSYKKWKAD